MKEVFGIFKWDKTMFSNQELERQIEAGKRIKIILAIFSFMFLIYVEFNYFEFVFRIGVKCSEKMLFLLYVGVLFPIVVLAYFLIKLNGFLLERKICQAKAQLQKNLKKIQRQDILSCIEEKQFSELGIEWAMIDELFRMCIKSGIIEIIASDKGVSISVSENAKNIEPAFIEKDKILDYFLLLKEDKN